jgi:hypothetical protein
MVVVGGQRHGLVSRFSPVKETSVPLYRVGPRADLEKLAFLPPGFDPRTSQSVASRYTDRAIPAHRGQTGLCTESVRTSSGVK